MGDNHGTETPCGYVRSQHELALHWRDGGGPSFPNQFSMTVAVTLPATRLHITGSKIDPMLNLC